MSDIASLRGTWLTVAETPYRIPLPWLCMFREGDLRPCTITFHHSKIAGGEQRQLLGKFAILNPSTSVKEAKSNLARARPVFDILAGDPETGAKHRKEAMASLDELPLDYLTIDPTEILLMDDLKTGAMTLASALCSGEASFEAKRKIAGLVASAGAEENFGGLHGGFRSPAFFLKHKRSSEEAKNQLEMLAKLDTCNLAQTGSGYEPLPLDLNALNPPESFWEDVELVKKGSQQLTVSHSKPASRDGKKYYSTSLTNISGKRIRVRMFAGFGKNQDSYVLANYTKQ